MSVYITTLLVITSICTACGTNRSNSASDAPSSTTASASKAANDQRGTHHFRSEINLCSIDAVKPLIATFFGNPGDEIGCKSVDSDLHPNDPHNVNFYVTARGYDPHFMIEVSDDHDNDIPNHASSWEKNVATAPNFPNILSPGAAINGAPTLRSPDGTWIETPYGDTHNVDVTVQGFYQTLSSAQHAEIIAVVQAIETAAFD